MSFDSPEASTKITSNDSTSPGKMASQETSLVPSTDESKFIQQHLANERTFLAWIRTIIAILGVGFITTNLHFELSTGTAHYANVIIEGIGIVTVLIGVVSTVFTAYSYLRKRKGINTSTFQSSGVFIIFLSSSIAILVIVMFAYLIFAF